jgi:MerR family copper efflux transcriptional regulator
MADNIRLPIVARGVAPLVPPAAGAADEASLMQVGDLARDSGKTVRAIHLYEEMQLLQPAARSKGRYRLYGPEALVRIRWIGKLQDMGFSLTDIQTIVRDWEASASAPSAMVKMREVYRRKLEETREHLQRLKALEHDIVSSLDYLDTCDTCEPERLLAQCTSCDHHNCSEPVPELVAGFHTQAHTQVHDKAAQTLKAAPASKPAPLAQAAAGRNTEDRRLHEAVGTEGP